MSNWFFFIFLFIDSISLLKLSIFLFILPIFTCLLINTFIIISFWLPITLSWSSGGLTYIVYLFSCLWFIFSWFFACLVIFTVFWALYLKLLLFRGSFFLCWMIVQEASHVNSFSIWNGCNLVVFLVGFSLLWNEMFQWQDLLNIHVRF